MGLLIKVLADDLDRASIARHNAEAVDLVEFDSRWQIPMVKRSWSKLNGDLCGEVTWATW